MHVTVTFWYVERSKTWTQPWRKSLGLPFLMQHRISHQGLDWWIPLLNPDMEWLVLLLQFSVGIMTNSYPGSGDDTKMQSILMNCSTSSINVRWNEYCNFMNLGMVHLAYTWNLITYIYVQKVQKGKLVSCFFFHHGNKGMQVHYQRAEFSMYIPYSTLWNLRWIWKTAGCCALSPAGLRHRYRGHASRV